MAQRYEGRASIEDIEARVTINDVGRRAWKATVVEAERKVWAVGVGDLRLSIRLLDGEWAGRTAIARFDGPQWSDGALRRIWFRIKGFAPGQQQTLLRGVTAFADDQ